jgi:hypothetical protein
MSRAVEAMRGLFFRFDVRWGVESYEVGRSDAGAASCGG